jgi:hypothetical protein
MRRGAAAGITVLASLLAAAGPAGAICLGESLQEDLDRAEIVFVGRVTSAHEATVDVRVEQVWKGGPVSERTTIHYLQFEPVPSFTTGHRYLFAPRRQRDRLVDDKCSATREYSGAVARLAPPTVTLPRRSASGSSGVAVQAAIALALVAIAVIVGVLASRLRRRRAPVPLSPS